MKLASSADTFLCKRVFHAAISSAIAMMAVANLVVFDGGYKEFFVTMAAVAGGWFTIRIHLFDFADEVQDHGTLLVVKKGRQTRKIP